VVNVSDPSNPYEEGFYDTPGNAHGVAVSGIYAYVADWSYFGIYDCSEALPVLEDTPSHAPKTYFLYPAHPNPFNPTTTISFELPTSELVHLAIYDISGRWVAELVNGWRAAGTHQVTFDGSGLASGIYIYQLQAGKFEASGKMVLMK
jgi:hypothetical protein